MKNNVFKKNNPLNEKIIKTRMNEKIKCDIIINNTIKNILNEKQEVDKCKDVIEVYNNLLKFKKELQNKIKIIYGDLNVKKLKLRLSYQKAITISNFKNSWFNNIENRELYAKIMIINLDKEIIKTQNILNNLIINLNEIELKINFINKTYNLN